VIYQDSFAKYRKGVSGNRLFGNALVDGIHPGTAHAAMFDNVNEPKVMIFTTNGFLPPEAEVFASKGPLLAGYISNDVLYLFDLGRKPKVYMLKYANLTDIQNVQGLDIIRIMSLQDFFWCNGPPPPPLPATIPPQPAPPSDLQQDAFKNQGDSSSSNTMLMAGVAVLLLIFAIASIWMLKNHRGGGDRSSRIAKKDQADNSDEGTSSSSSSATRPTSTKAS
jgi:hypothetical protein